VNPVRNIKCSRRKQISNGVKVIIKNLQKKIPIYPKRIKKAVLDTFASEGIKKLGEITVCFTTDNQIRELNLLYLGEYAATDVISFSLVNTKKELTADIAVSGESAIRNARIFKTTPAGELYLYVVHGVLHLLGYDDNTQRNRKIMQEKAQNICLSIKPKP
jgi:probable rRNA maturation factor